MKLCASMVAYVCLVVLNGPVTGLAGDTDEDRVQQLATEIDRLIASRWSESKVNPAPSANDAEFLRRVYIDVAGKIPPVSAVRQFLDDRSINRRRDVVNRLLESPAYITHFSTKWRRVLIPEANADLQVQTLLPTFEAWLRTKLTENASYAEIVREILTLPLESRSTRSNRNRNPYERLGAVTPLVFYQAKQVAPESLAAATSRIFLGIRLECAQCHDHPFDAWKQDDFWKFAAFYAGIERKNPDRGIFGEVSELFDRREIGIPATDRVVQAAYLDGSQPQWRFRVGPRATLADWMTSVNNPYFARTAVNRIWEHFFGIGLVDPVDDFGPDNPASHPELLDLLATKFAAQRFDLKFLIRAITASRVYGLTSRKTHQSQSNPRLFARMAVKRMAPEQIFESLAQATGHYQPFVARRPYRGTDSRSEIIDLFSNETDSSIETHTTILQALAMMNGQFVVQATDVAGSRTLTAVASFPLMGTSERIDTLFLATLSRPPRDEERERLVEYVEGGGPARDSDSALADVFWALLNSSELLLNH